MHATPAALDYAEALTAIAPALTASEYDVIPGRRYDRIVSVLSNGQRTAHAFVDRTTGDVLKAAGWSRPAPGVRGNVATAEGLEALVAAARRSPSYLYAR